MKLVAASTNPMRTTGTNAARVRSRSRGTRCLPKSRPAIAGRDFGKHLVPLDRDRTRAAFVPVVRMGFVLAATSFISTGVQLAARVIVARWASLDDVGYF